MRPLEPSGRWEHFPHEADMGVRGYGSTKAQAFEQAALALMAIITDPLEITPQNEGRFSCDAPDDEVLLVEWLDKLIYEMACNHMIYSRFHVTITDHHLDAIAHGEPVDRVKHEPAVEIKGATFTELSVRLTKEKGWVAQCVVDV
jgi:SHS2 domain-containing protein